MNIAGKTPEQVLDVAVREMREKIDKDAEYYRDHLHKHLNALVERALVEMRSCPLPANFLESAKAVFVKDIDVKTYGNQRVQRLSLRCGDYDELIEADHERGVLDPGKYRVVLAFIPIEDKQ